METIEIQFIGGTLLVVVVLILIIRTTLEDLILETAEYHVENDGSAGPAHRSPERSRRRGRFEKDEGEWWEWEFLRYR